MGVASPWKPHKGRQGNVCTIASVLSDEYKSVCLKSVKTKADYEAVVELAQDRGIRIRLFSSY
jgi:hypothetical protein